MIQRELGYVRVINEPALSRIKNNQCPSCGKPKEEWTRRRDWRCCSPECTTKFESFCIIRTWGEMRDRCFARDNYRCAMCKKIPTKDITLQTLSDEDFKDLINRYNGMALIVNAEKKFAILADDSQLVADHIKPIAIGGAQWDINNLQTLCIDCNKIKTAEDMGRIANVRNIEKMLINQRKLEEVIPIERI
jgi:5-methylcytosine-specific restriction endonuclease McrA